MQSNFSGFAQFRHRCHVRCICCVGCNAPVFFILTECNFLFVITANLMHMYFFTKNQNVRQTHFFWMPSGKYPVVSWQRRNVVLWGESKVTDSLTFRTRCGGARPGGLHGRLHCQWHDRCAHRRALRRPGGFPVDDPIKSPSYNQATTMTRRISGVWSKNSVGTYAIPTSSSVFLTTNP